MERYFITQDTSVWGVVFDDRSAADKWADEHLRATRYWSGCPITLDDDIDYEHSVRGYDILNMRDLPGLLYPTLQTINQHKLMRFDMATQSLVEAPRWWERISTIRDQERLARWHLGDGCQVVEIGDYQGEVLAAVHHAPSGYVFAMELHYGSCSGCDIWQGFQAKNDILGVIGEINAPSILTMTPDEYRQWVARRCDSDEHAYTLEDDEAELMLSILPKEAR